MKTIYLAWDTQADEIVGAFTSEESARNALVKHLEGNCGYSEAEWEDIAHGYGQDVDEFKDMVRAVNWYDEDLDIMVQEVALKD